MSLWAGSSQPFTFARLQQLLTQLLVGQKLWPQTANEAGQGVTPAQPFYKSGPYRYGAKGDGVTDDTAAWATVGKISGYHFSEDGTFLLTAKVQSSAYITVEGSTRQNTELTFGAIADYVLEIGDVAGGPNPNVGALNRLRFVGGAGASTTGALHMNALSHMWQLNELLFQGTGGPAIVVTNCWDSNYTNIDILSCGNTGGAPSTDAGLIVTGGCNNLYFRGLRVEQCPSGCIYVGSSGPIWIVTGKCDQGFIVQYAATVNVDTGADLSLDDFSITGSNGQYSINTFGALHLGRVRIDGGTNKEAHISDRRTWSLVNSINDPTYSDPSYGPQIPVLDLGRGSFGYAHPSVSNVTGAVLNSKQTMRLVQNLTTTANGAVSGNTITIGTNLAITANDEYKGCYLVHNPTGTQAAGQPGARRRIVNCYTGGNMVLEGTWGVTLDSDWSLEYCGGHYTPRLRIEGIDMDAGLTPFAILATGVTITGGTTYQASSAGGQGGGTTFAISSAAFPANTDATGYYLIDEITGEAFLIYYGVDGTGQIGIMYDYTGTGDPERVLNTGHTFSIVAGFAGGVRTAGANYEWSFAGKRRSCPIELAQSYGFDADNLPLWGLGFDQGSFTGTLTGMTAATTGTVYFSLQDNLVTLRSVGSILGTSNATTLTMTGLPKHLIPFSARLVPCAGLTDASSDYHMGTATVNADGSITFGLANVSGSAVLGGGAFTNAGIKGLDSGWQIAFSIDS